jgi:adenylosuccinate lyase
MSLTSRYASPEMIALFSPEERARTWRQLWVHLARAEMEQGLPITKAQVAELEKNIGNVDLEAVATHERRLRHDVMAHIEAYGDQCPGARGIIHLGATSSFVTDNGDLILMRRGLAILRQKLAEVLGQLLHLAQSYRDLPCLGYTHFQAAQPTTVGKRVCLWAQDLMADLEALQLELPFLGVKGATGTQASFAQLVDDPDKLEKRVAELAGFEKVIPVAGQTYSRKIDARLLDALAGIGVSANKLATDIRLLAHSGEMEEPFEQEQVGSSAMPHKRNPILSERICGLSRFLIQSSGNGKWTAASQWLERSLDDSSNRRLVIPECFMAADAILNLLHHVTANPVLYPQRIAENLERELPHLATESILMACVQKGCDRQEIHERLRHHVQEGGNLLARIADDEAIPFDVEELDVKQLIGRAPEQVDRFVPLIHEAIAPYKDAERITPSIEF